MEERDAGNKPQVGDRLAFIYVDSRKDEKKQGDKIEHIDFVKEQKMKPDVNFYITNQIQNPVAQLFALCIEQLEGYTPPLKSYKTIYQDMLEKHNGDEEEATLSVLKKKEDQLEKMMFMSSPLLSKMAKAAVKGPMDAFLGKRLS
jgi:hypothetical protein